MGKPSSSLKKKKRSKISSQARIKKRSKSKTRRSNKLKKLRRRDDSVSYSSDNDDSSSSVSISSSSSEDDFRSKRSRSRIRKDVKGSKMRASKRSSSSKSIEDLPRVKKRKGSKKNNDFQAKKKRHDKKRKKKKSRARRDVSVSSRSSGSWSCSTCNSSGDERGTEKNRGTSESKYKDRRRLEKVKKERKRRSRSMSFSSHGQFSEHSDHEIEDKLASEVNSRRLKSVITVVRDGQDLTGMFNDEHKEEMIYDHDDYPSSRSNDSNDGGCKREFVHKSHVASEEKKHAEDEIDEAVVSNISTSKVRETDRNFEGHDGGNPRWDGVEINDDVKGKANQDSGAADSGSGYDLELILRQKALENLKIRRGHQSDAKVLVNPEDECSCEVNTTSTTNSTSSQSRYSKGGGPRVIGASHLAKLSSTPFDISLNDDKIFDRNGNGKGSVSVGHDVQHAPGPMALVSDPKKGISVPVSSKADNQTSVLLASKSEPLSTCTSKKQLRTLQDPQVKSISRNNVDKSTVEALPSFKPLNDGEETHNGSASTNDGPSSTNLSSGGSSSNKLQEETNEDSQYQQKTMTVMRGGEMVEVSYKVYIPKKAPALARRQLKR